MLLRKRRQLRDGWCHGRPVGSLLVLSYLAHLASTLHSGYGFVSDRVSSDAIGRVRLCDLNQLTFDRDFSACVWVMTIARRGLKV